MGLDMKLESIFQYLNGLLLVEGYPDYPHALNGMQVDGQGEVGHVAVAVDASEATISEAVNRGADLLIVHHGLFWKGLQPVTGRHFRKIRKLIEGQVSLYSCHLPLDSHPEVGNCILMARALGLEIEGPFGEHQGVNVGWWGRKEEGVASAALAGELELILKGPVRLIEGGPEVIERIGVVTGAGGSFIEESVGLGLDALITGEISHAEYFDAVELGISVLLGGHYATETFGVKALGAHLEERFGLTWEFLEQPTGF